MWDRGFRRERPFARRLLGEILHQVLDADDADAAAMLGKEAGLFVASGSMGKPSPIFFELANYRDDEPWLRTRPRMGEVLEMLRESRRLPEYADFRAFRRGRRLWGECLPERDLPNDGATP